MPAVARLASTLPGRSVVGVSAAPASSPESSSDNVAPGVGGVVKRIAWGALTLFLAAFAVFESQKYGLPTTAACPAFLYHPTEDATVIARL